MFSQPRLLRGFHLGWQCARLVGWDQTLGKRLNNWLLTWKREICCLEVCVREVVYQQIRRVRVLWLIYWVYTASRVCVVMLEVLWWVDLCVMLVVTVTVGWMLPECGMRVEMFLSVCQAVPLQRG